MKSISLHCQEGTSDKEYHLSIVPSGEGYLVNYANGPRGRGLTYGTKTTSPVSLEAAEKLYNATLKEKLKKHYKPIGETLVIENTTTDKVDSGFRGQLLNDISEQEAQRYIQDDRYIMQEKHDGRRLSLKKQRSLTGINKLGYEIPVHPAFGSLKDIAFDFHLETEDLGQSLVAFDLLDFKGQDLRAFPYRERLKFLEQAVSLIDHNAISYTQTAYTTQEKAALYNQVLSSGGEGIVFKLADAPFTPGRPASLGPQLKCKFYKEASFIVAKINTKRSVLLSLYDDSEKFVSVGNVTIPADKSIPSVGQVVEVRYLYAIKKSGSVYQPTYKDVRDDVRPEECIVSQLKYKGEQLTDED